MKIFFMWLPKSTIANWENMTIQSYKHLSIKSYRTLSHCLKGQRNEIRRKWKLHEMATETTHYIHDIVWHSLTTQPADLDYLICVKDACRAKEFSSVDIFTLNHDTVIEQFLDLSHVKYTDGFGPPINDVRYWSPERFEDHSYNVRLLKLHGSVNWFLFKPNTATGRYEPVGIPLGGDFWHT